MEVTLAKVRAIFDTLPIGYYLGRNIKMELSEVSSQSYFNPIGDYIVISAPCILETARKKAIAAGDVEELIRGLFYHEISHVILTGKVCVDAEKHYSSSTKRFHDIVNIVEDERIETILRTYYMKTNFRKNIFLINDYHGQAPKDAFEGFYYLVRFHVGPEEYLNKLKDLIKDYKNLNAASDLWTWRSYLSDIEKFYRDFVKNFDPNDFPQGNEGDMGDSGDSEGQQGSGSGKSSGKSSGSQSGSQSGNSDGSDESDDDQDGDGDQNGNGNKNGDKNGNQNGNQGGDQDGEGSGSMAGTNDIRTDGDEDDGNGTSSGDQDGDNKAAAAKASDGEGDGNEAGTAESEAAKDAEKKAGKVKEFDIPGAGRGLENSIMKKAIAVVLNVYVNEVLQTRIRKILETVKKKKGTFGAAYQSYSGRINPRACDRDDYKYWVKDNRTGSNKMFTKTHFNLFIDHSGSFSGCDLAINMLLKALMGVVSPDFDFDVITIDTQIVEWDRPDQYIFEANGGTDLRNDIAPIFRKHQKRGCNNFNIVVFDGEAHDRSYSQSTEPFNNFDTNNTVLVVDSSNERFVRHLHSCKKTIISGNYEKYFIDEVLSLLERTIY